MFVTLHSLKLTGYRNQTPPVDRYETNTMGSLLHAQMRIKGVAANLKTTNEQMELFITVNKGGLSERCAVRK